ncbi:MAG: peptide chain release factor N(5)-glutamine methyltransferase [Eubacteriales bacterium]
MKITLQKLYYDGIAILEKENLDNIKNEVIMLIESALNITKVYFLTHPNEVVDLKDYNIFIQKVKRRARREPLQYIIGHQAFMGLDFYVNSNVLIPRPETEILVEEVLKVINNKRELNVLDLCTGSGCIAISLGYYSKLNHIVAVDISKEALHVANKNAKQNNVNITFIKSDLFIDLKEDFLDYFDVIVSNPPYIPKKQIGKLMIEVKDYEPSLALDGHEDGLFFYKEIAKKAKNYLREKGRLFFEIGFDQGQSVSDILKKEQYNSINVKKDLAGLDRIVSGRI